MSSPPGDLGGKRAGLQRSGSDWSFMANTPCFASGTAYTIRRGGLVDASRRLSSERPWVFGTTLPSAHVGVAAGWPSRAARPAARRFSVRCSRACFRCRSGMARISRTRFGRVAGCHSCLDGRSRHRRGHWPRRLPIFSAWQCPHTAGSRLPPTGFACRKRDVAAWFKGLERNTGANSAGRRCITTPYGEAHVQ